MRHQSLLSRSQIIGAAATFGVAGFACAAEPATVPVQNQGWPREISQNKVRFTLYQPQIDEWQGYRTLKVRLAISMTPPGEAPALGVAELTGETAIDNETRTVVIRNIRVTSARFNAGKSEDVIRLAALLKQNFPSAPATVSLDRLLAGVKISKEAAAPVELKMDIPTRPISDNREIHQRLNQDAIARDRGARRTHQFQTQRSLGNSDGFQGRGGGFQRGGGGGGFQHRGGGGFHRR